METFIIILLIVIVLELYNILGRLRHIDDVLQRIWQGLFNDSHGGLGRLDYLKYIDTKLEKIDIIKKIAEEVKNISENIEVVRDEIVNKN